jgi:hypothetical protein
MKNQASNKKKKVFSVEKKEVLSKKIYFSEFSQILF